MKTILFSTILVFFGNGMLLAKDNQRRKNITSSKVVSQSKTTIDFNETMIDGKMKAPQGFFIQGRQSQSLSQMVKLRSGFQNRLDSSIYSVRAVVK